MQAGFQQQLSRTVNCLRRQRQRCFAAKAHLYSAVSESFDENEDIGWSAATQASHGIHQIFDNHDRPSQSIEEDTGNLQVYWRGMAATAQPGSPSKHQGRGV